MHSYVLTDDSDTETDEICHPVIEWANILSEPNYHEIGDDRKIQPSHDDHRAEEIATKSIKQVNNKYQISIAFRNIETHVPNNFRNAKWRLENQLRMLINDEDRTNKYIKKIKRLLDVNYIEKVEVNDYE